MNRRVRADQSPPATDPAAAAEHRATPSRGDRVARAPRPRSDRRRSHQRSGVLLDAVSWLVPPALGLSVGARVAAGSAWLIENGMSPYASDALREYPARVGVLLRETFSRDEARRLLRARLAFLIARRLGSHALATPGGRRRLLAHLTVDGMEHLAAARAQGRGVVLVTTHFGFPYLMRIVLRSAGIPQRHVQPDDNAKGSSVPVSGGPWERMAALKQLRAALAGGAACVVLADGRMGSPVRVPLLGDETTIALGAFYLGYLARCPIVPFFTVMPDAPSLRLEIAPPLTPPQGSSPDALAAVAEEFVGIYRAYVRRYPSHLPSRLLRRDAVATDVARP